MRPSLPFIVLFVCLFLLNSAQVLFSITLYDEGKEKTRQMQQLVSLFGSGDLAISTEARYIRHLSVSDQLVPYMDHPGALEHFPTGSVWIPYEQK